MRAFTDIFIRHPVLALVVNLVILLVGTRAIFTLPVQLPGWLRGCLVGRNHRSNHRRGRIPVSSPGASLD